MFWCTCFMLKQVDALLTAYELDVSGMKGAKRRRLRRFLGVRHFLVTVLDRSHEDDDDEEEEEQEE
jgi:hypothetical protein